MFHSNLVREGTPNGPDVMTQLLNQCDYLCLLEKLTFNQARTSANAGQYARYFFQPLAYRWRSGK